MLPNIAVQILPEISLGEIVRWLRGQAVSSQITEISTRDSPGVYKVAICRSDSDDIMVSSLQNSLMTRFTAGISRSTSLG